MFVNNLIVTFRSLWKSKGYSFLNIFGLAIGIACAGLIFLWVEDETHYDDVNTKKDRLYAIGVNENFDGKIFTFNGVMTNATPGPLAAAIQNEIPGIANSGRISQGRNILFGLDDKSIYEQGYYIDPSIFDMFTIRFMEGSAKSAFKELYSVVISEKMASHFFGSQKNVIGKTIRANNEQSYTVSGVFKDLPENTSIRFEWVAPFEIYLSQNDYLKKEWGMLSINTFVELSPGASVARVNEQLHGIIQKRQPTSNARSFLFAMNDWRLRSNFQDGKQTGGLIQYIHLFTLIAWIILIIACINFMNLATARSGTRAKEVGVRKVLGAGKETLVAQFIGEALYMSFLAVLLGLFLIAIVLPFFNNLVGKQMTIGLNNPLHIAALIAVAIVSGLIAGSYPALYLSSFNPIYVFKGIKLKNSSASFVRKGLVVVQFSVSIILIISTIIIYQQIQHIKNRELGYDRFNLITTGMKGDMIKHYDAIKQDLLSTGAVENVALNSMNTLYTGDNGSVQSLSWPGKNPNLNMLISFRSISPGFIATAGMKMAEGREFLNEETDSANTLVTESFAKLMGPGSAIDKTISFGENFKVHVVGVVKDFVYGNMYGSPDPVVFGCLPNEATLMYIRIKSKTDPGQALAKIAAVMKKDNPAYPFEYSFLDDQFNQIFSSETLVGRLSRIFAALAIVISCLGLFGLSAYTAERRTKEIGIRKVLGASVSNVTRLLSKEFLQLVLLSSLIAFPIAWWSMSGWLQSYTYRIHIQWWVFIAAAAGAVLIALFTISFQSIRAALANPVNSLRSE